VGVPKAPTIHSVWAELSPEVKDKVTEMFLNWLVVAGQSVKSNEDLIVLANLASYHSEDLKDVFANALKPEFRDVVDTIAGLIGGGV